MKDGLTLGHSSMLSNAKLCQWVLNSAMEKSQVFTLFPHTFHTCMSGPRTIVEAMDFLLCQPDAVRAAYILRAAFVSGSVLGHPTSLFKHAHSFGSRVSPQVKNNKAYRVSPAWALHLLTILSVSVQLIADKHQN